MMRLLQALLSIAIPLFAISSMASVGLRHGFRKLTRPLRRPSLVVRALIANYVLVPLFCLLVLRAFDLTQDQATGLFVISCAAGAPFLLALTRTARADMALAGGLLILLLPCTLLFLPIVLPLALPGVRVDVGDIASTLALTMFLPLALGFVVRRWNTRVARRLVPTLGKVSKYSLLVLIAATVLTNLREIAMLTTTPAIPATVLLILGAMFIGLVMASGSPNADAQFVHALGTGQRNIAAAMIVASTGFETSDPLVIIVAASLIGFAVLFPTAWFFRSRLGRPLGTRRIRFRLPEAGWFTRRGKA